VNFIYANSIRKSHPNRHDVVYLFLDFPLAIAEREIAVAEREIAVAEREIAVAEREIAVAEREIAVAA